MIGDMELGKPLRQEDADATAYAAQHVATAIPDQHREVKWPPACPKRFRSLDSQGRVPMQELEEGEKPLEVPCAGCHKSTKRSEIALGCPGGHGLFGCCNDKHYLCIDCKEAKEKVLLLKVESNLELSKCLAFNVKDTTTGMTYHLALGGLLLPLLVLFYWASGRDPTYGHKRVLGHISWAHNHSYVVGAMAWFAFVAAVSTHGTRVPQRKGKDYGLGRLLDRLPVLLLLGACAGVSVCMDPGFFLDAGLPLLVVAGGSLASVLAFEHLRDKSPTASRFRWVQRWDAMLLPGFFLLVSPIVPATWVLYEGWRQQDSTHPTSYRDLLIRMVVAGVFSPIAVTCYWTMRRPTSDAGGLDRYVLESKWTARVDSPEKPLEGCRIFLLDEDSEEFVLDDSVNPSPKATAVPLPADQEHREPAGGCSAAGGPSAGGGCDAATEQTETEEAETERGCRWSLSEPANAGQVKLKKQKEWEWKRSVTRRSQPHSIVRALLCEHQYCVIYAEVATYVKIFKMRIYNGYVGVWQMFFDASLEAVFAWLVIQYGITTPDTPMAPCQSPVADPTTCGVPCLNVMDWWAANFSYRGFNGTSNVTVSLDPSDKFCMRYPEVVDMGMRFECISLGIMLITCGTAFYNLYQLSVSFDALRDAVAVYVWQVPPPIPGLEVERTADKDRFEEQKEFLKHMISVRTAPVLYAERLKILDEYNLNWLPLVPTKQAVRKLYKMPEAELPPDVQPASSSSSSTAPASSSSSSTADPRRSDAISWEWWFRYFWALHETVDYYYWRLWYVLIGLVIAWVVFVLDLLIQAGIAAWQATVTKEMNSILFVSAFFGLPVLLAIVLGSYVNRTMDGCLEALTDDLIQSPVDKQYLQWAKNHLCKLTLCGWEMSFSMVMTVLTSLLTSLGLYVLFSVAPGLETTMA